MATLRSGGGIKSNKTVHRPSPKVEPKARAINPGGAGQIGLRVGDHTMHGRETGYRGEKLDAGRGYQTPVGPTDNVKAVGVGGGREIHRSGSQTQHGDVAGPPPVTPRKLEG